MRRSAQEIEAKLIATRALEDGEVRRAIEALGDVRVSTDSQVTQTDTYFDDEGLHLARHRIGLRLREIDGEPPTLEWKAVETHSGGMFHTLESRRPWRRDAPPRRASNTGRALRERLEPFVYRAELRSIAVLCTERARLSVQNGRTRAAVCVDRTHANGKRVEFEELEVELLEGEPKQIEAWANALRATLPLKPAGDDKLARVLASCGTTPTEVSTALRRTTPVREFCDEWSRLALTNLQRAEFAARVDPSVSNARSLLSSANRLRDGIDAVRRYLPEPEAGAARRAAGQTARACRSVIEIGTLLEIGAESELSGRTLRNGAMLVAGRWRANATSELDGLSKRLRKRRRQVALQEFQTLLDLPLSSRMPTRARTNTVATAAIREAFEAFCAARPKQWRRATQRLLHVCEMFSALYATQLEWLTQPLEQLGQQLESLHWARASARALTTWSTTAKAPSSAIAAAGAMLGAHQRAVESWSASAAEALEKLTHADHDARVRDSLRARTR